MDIRNVLVPVDFSPTSQFAVDFAVPFARKFRAKLTLLHVMESPTSLTYMFPNETDKTQKQLEDRVTARLSGLLSPEDQDDLDLQARVRHGSIETEIIAAIEDEDASIVIMGKHHRSLVRRLLLGSVAEDLVRKLPVPVLTLSHDAPLRKFSRILFATDLSESYRQGFVFALELAHSMSAELLVLHSLEQFPLDYSGNIPVVEIEAEKTLRFAEARRILEGLEAEGTRHEVKVRAEVTEGTAAERILAAAKDSQSDLIALTIEDKGLVERALLGSTAERIIRDADVPVLSVPVSVEAVPVSNGRRLTGPHPIPTTT